MSNLTLYLLLWPALAGLFILFIKGQQAKKVAFGAAVVELVLAHGADKNLRDSRGLTALDMALRMGNDAALPLLQ